MKKVAVFLAICFSVFFSVVSAKAPPDKIINHNYSAIDGELGIDPLKSYVRAKVDMKMFLYPEGNSKIIGSFYTGETAKVVGLESVYFPLAHPVVLTQGIPSWRGWTAAQYNHGKSLPRPKDTIYLLSYAGEGDVKAYYNGSIITIPAEGIEGLVLSGTMGIKEKWAVYNGSAKTFGDIKKEYWICIKLNDGSEGWVKFNSRDDWYTIRGSGIYIDPQFLDKAR